MTPNQVKWIEALQSGDYEQNHDGNLCIDNKYCCLGVAAELFKTKDNKIEEITFDSLDNNELKTIKRYDGESYVAPKYVINALNLKDDVGTNLAYNKLSLACLNDKGTPFKAIADIVMSNPQDWFN